MELEPKKDSFWQTSTYCKQTRGCLLAQFAELTPTLRIKTTIGDWKSEANIHVYKYF
jgi:hypothetical protein